MATTPEVSAAIAETQAAFSINFTPSHNPFAYHGYKFNPADGGPATKELTVAGHRARQRAAPRLARRSHARRERVLESQGRPERYRSADPIALYRRALARRLPFFDLANLVERINASDIELFIDNGFGATRGKYERLLEGVAPGGIHVMNGGEDFLFGGKSREPSVENFPHPARCDEKFEGAPRRRVHERRRRRSLRGWRPRGRSRHEQVRTDGRPLSFAGARRARAT